RDTHRRCPAFSAMTPSGRFPGWEAMPRRLNWASWPDEKLLDLRLKDLRLRIPGTWLQSCLNELYGELEERGIDIRPHAWLSNEWFSPVDSPGIAIPFFLAHPRLMRLERRRILEV